MIEKLMNSFAQGFSQGVVSDVTRQIEATANKIAVRAKRKLLLFAIKVTFLILALVTLVGGFVLLGAKYIGLEWMLLASGAILFLGFLLS